jgi:hypothetical protein
VYNRTDKLISTSRSAARVHEAGKTHIIISKTNGRKIIPRTTGH